MPSISLLYSLKGVKTRVWLWQWKDLQGWLEFCSSPDIIFLFFSFFSRSHFRVLKPLGFVCQQKRRSGVSFLRFHNKLFWFQDTKRRTGFLWFWFLFFLLEKKTPVFLSGTPSPPPPLLFRIFENNKKNLRVSKTKKLRKFFFFFFF